MASHSVAPPHLWSVLICSSHMLFLFLSLCFSPHCVFHIECLSQCPFPFVNPIPSFKPISDSAFCMSHFLISQKVCDWSDLPLYFSCGMSYSSLIRYFAPLPYSPFKAGTLSCKYPYIFLVYHALLYLEYCFHKYLLNLLSFPLSLFLLPCTLK